MEKTFSKIEIITIKSIAKNVAPYVAKKQKIEQQIAEAEEKVAEKIRKRATEKIEKLEAEKASYQDIIDSMNVTVKKMTGGYTTEDLVDCVKEGTGKMDENTGKEITRTRFVLKYPETVVPNTVPPTAEGEAGSDYDKDVETFQETIEPSSDYSEEAGTSEEDEMPEEIMAEKADIAAEVDIADPFSDSDPFN